MLLSIGSQIYICTRHKKLPFPPSLAFVVIFLAGSPSSCELESQCSLISISPVVKDGELYLRLDCPAFHCNLTLH